MSWLALRRMVPSGKVYNEFSYIQDGLVFQLDGINKGGTTGRWTDLKGGIYFSYPASGVTENSNNVNLNNVSISANASDGVNSGVVGVGYTSGTIEVCILRTSGNIVLNNQLNLIGFLIGSTRVSFGNIYSGSGNNSYTSQIPIDEISIASINDDRAIINDVTYTTKSNNGWNGTNLRLGGRDDGQYGFVGNIYAIRVYNRKLSESEMLHNINVDKNRFSE